METSVAPTSPITGRPLLRLGVLVGIFLAGIGMPVSGEQGVHAWAQSEQTMQLGPPLEGQITHVSLTSIEVEKKSYQLHPKATITLEGGQPLDMNQLQPGQGVQFWLKEGAMYRIIAILPR